MHHPRPPRVGLQQILLASLLVIVAIGTPDSAMAQASPFMTGATALQTKTFGRAGGSSAASAAAYRAGERIRDERTGRIYDHSERLDVLHKEIVLPSQFADEDMAWARDRSNLWNSAESAETRKDARVAREYLVALPVELSPPQRLELVRGFSQELSDRYGFGCPRAARISGERPPQFSRTSPRDDARSKVGGPGCQNDARDEGRRPPKAWPPARDQ
jgi:hypothetical protein